MLEAARCPCGGYSISLRCRFDKNRNLDAGRWKLHGNFSGIFIGFVGGFWGGTLGDQKLKAIVGSDGDQWAYVVPKFSFKCLGF